MQNCKGLITPAVILIVCAVCVVGAYVSNKYLGPDNPVEEELELITEDELEVLVHAPQGSLKPEVDAVFPHAKDKSK